MHYSCDSRIEQEGQMALNRSPEIYLKLTYSSLVKADHVPGDSTSHFWSQRHYLNKLGRGPLGDATYQISRLEALWFQTRRFFMFSQHRPM